MRTPQLHACPTSGRLPEKAFGDMARTLPHPLHKATTACLYLPFNSTPSRPLRCPRRDRHLVQQCNQAPLRSFPGQSEQATPRGHSSRPMNQDPVRNDRKPPPTPTAHPSPAPASTRGSRRGVRARKRTNGHCTVDGSYSSFDCNRSFQTRNIDL